MARERRDGFRAVILDVNGVLVDSPHEHAWREALQELMEGPWRDIRGSTSWEPGAPAPDVYREVISGRPRMSGARAALEHYGVPDIAERAEAYAARKQAMVVELIEAGRFTAYPDALGFVLAVRAAGIRLATASSSRNARLLLGRIRLDVFARESGLTHDFVTPGLSLLGLIDVNVSGRRFEQGKPHPEIFLTAAAELGCPPDRCVVVEDAVSGIQAATAGGMRALGVARADDARMLTDAGAALVVPSLDRVDVAGLTRGLLIAKEH